MYWELIVLIAFMKARKIAGGKMQKYLLKMCLLYFLILSYSVAQGKLGWLEDLKNSGISWNSPVVIPNLDGGYIAFWGERKEMREEYSFPPEHYFYRLIDANGMMLVSKKEFDFWSVAPHPTYFGVSFSSKSMLWFNPDTLLILAWKAFGHSYSLERILINSNGTVVRGPDSVKGNAIGPDAVLIKDIRGNVVAVECGIGYDWRARILKVHPQFGEVKKVGTQNNDILKWFLTSDNAVAITSIDKLLFCYRLKTKTDEPIWEAPEGWAGMPNDLICFLTNLDGTLVGKPRRIDLTKDAFRKMPGIHLGGNYGYNFKNAWRDLDLSNLPNGDIILSVTGLDEKGSLCVYQVKFTAEGILIKPDLVEVVQPRAFPKDKMLSISKVASATIGLGEIPGKNKVLVRRELVLFGFDKEGNFYEEREVWRESEE